MIKQISFYLIRSNVCFVLIVQPINVQYIHMTNHFCGEVGFMYNISDPVRHTTLLVPWNQTHLRNFVDSSIQYLKWKFIYKMV